MTEAPLQECPRCGQRKVVTLRLTDENDDFQHTHYVCTFYGRRRGTPCGWHGWTIPGRPEH